IADSPADLRTEEDQFRSYALQLQSKIRTATPSAGPPPIAPWEKVTTLLDIYPNREGILWLQRPGYHEESVYAIAVRMEGKPSKFSAQLLRLTPGKEDRWEGAPIDVALRLQTHGLPTIGRDRHSLTFATAAAVYQKNYYLGTKENGIFVFPFDKGAP